MCRDEQQRIDRADDGAGIRGIAASLDRWRCATDPDSRIHTLRR
jgi:hypothetical protein